MGSSECDQVEELSACFTSSGCACVVAVWCCSSGAGLGGL